LGATAVINAGVQTAIEGGSFLNDLKGAGLSDLAALGAYEIGGAQNTLTKDFGTVGGELAYVGLHSALGCAASALGGTGCEGGAIGAAASAAFTSFIPDPTDSNGNPTSWSPGQVAALAGASTIIGGLAAGLAGQNAQAGALAAQNETLNNRVLHPQEQTLAQQLADKSGGRYTTQQIEDQMAQMNMTQNGQTFDGGVRVATGGQPDDGTNWQMYGTNQAGQQVWSQALSSGDAGIQGFIAQNANAMSGTTGMTYQQTTNAYTQFGVSLSGTLMLPFVAGGGGWNVGLSTDGTLGNTAFYVQAQANGMAGAGFFAGVGGSVGISHSNGQMLSGTSTSGYAEMDAGFGAAGSASAAINDDGTIGGLGGAAPAKVFPGVGFGAGVGAGLSKTTTYVSPSLGDLLGGKK